ncbi:hypothetical protein CLIB1444_05S07316 [[Candida] jaroonii]|uniref:Uncharacterized protein n=1 Tax=[Candida] jaroonii TaxID=467808 RepID=A0ACA9Y8D2_9ASCO|nr:hypothetical protein CLIB1444_05S07316 [[Candida] jaroonii]
MSHQQAIENNKKYFDKIANEYDAKILKTDLAKIIPEFLESQKSNFKGRLLDFACGTGIMIENLVGCFEEVVGVDINDNLLNIFSSRIKGKAYKIDILQESTEILGLFDVIVCTLAYHHLDDYEAITAKLSQLLAPEGTLYIVDLYNSDVENLNPRQSESVHNSVTHMGGLKKESLMSTLGKAGLKPELKFALEQPIWQMGDFIINHGTQKLIDDYKSGKLESKEIDGETFYSFNTDLVMAIGKK